MSSWITNGLKTLRVRVGGAVGSISQPRSPPFVNLAFGKFSYSKKKSLHYGAQVDEISVPPKPKRPLTPYFRFMGQVRTEIQRDNPNMKIPDIMKLIAQRWDRLEESAKQSYISAYKTDMESFSPILQKYNSSLTREQREAQQQLKLDKQLQREKREKKRRLKELGKPKKPASAFFMFLASKIPPGSAKEEYTSSAKKLADVWKSMSDAEKAPFASQYHQDVAAYEKALSKWEDKMVKQGNDDLVRENRKTSRASVK